MMTVALDDAAARRDTGDLIQAPDRFSERGDLLLDAFLHAGDIRGDRVDPRQHRAQHERVTVAEAPGERLLQRQGLGPLRPAGHPRQDLRVTLPGDSRGHHVPPRDAEDVGDHRREHDLSILEELLDPLLLGRVRLDQVHPVTRRSRKSRITGGGTKLARSICRSATLHNHTASNRSVFGRPGTCLTSLALTNHVSNPRASNR
jgi:hypothetical protein